MDYTWATLLAKALHRELPGYNYPAIREQFGRMTLLEAATFLDPTSPGALPRAEIPLTNQALELARRILQRTGARSFRKTQGLAPLPAGWEKSEVREENIQEMADRLFARPALPTPAFTSAEIQEAHTRLFGTQRRPSSPSGKSLPTTDAELNAVAARLFGRRDPRTGRPLG